MNIFIDKIISDFESLQTESTSTLYHNVRREIYATWNLLRQHETTIYGTEMTQDKI